MKRRDTISSVGWSSSEAFRSNLDLIQSKSVSDISYDELDYQRRRFNVWAGNINALINPRSQSSLDSRLAEAPLMTESVLWNLKTQRIIKGEQPNRSLKAGDEEEEIGEQQLRGTTELHHLSYGIQSSITQLFKISIIIRQLKPRGREVKSRDLPPLDPSPDIMHIGDKFSKSRATPWLMEKLGRAIVERRDFFRQQKARREKQLATETQDPIDQGATTFQGEDELLPLSSKPDQIYEESVASYATETSRATSTGGMDDEALRVPDPPYILPNGMEFEYGEPFECPYCLNIQTVKNRSRWKSHIFEDLQPYICTFEGCSPTLYSKRHEWFNHELQCHRAHWECIICKSFISQSEKQLSSHMLREHGNATTSTQIPVLVDAGRKPQTYFDATACPLCSDWASQDSGTNNLAQFRRHLGKHLEQLALSALPKSTTEDQSNSEDDAASEDAMSEAAENEESTNEELTDEDIKAIQWLEEEGFDRWGNDTTVGNRGALHYTAEEGHESIVKFLLKRGADVAKRGVDGATALHWAAYKRNFSIVKMLLAAGAPLEAQCSYGNLCDGTPLHWTACRHYPEGITLLLKAGAQVNARNTRNHTPLHVAVASDYYGMESIKVLIRYHADLEARNDNDETPLHLAVEKGKFSSVQYLLDARADINARGKRGTPLQLARKLGHTEIADILNGRGAEE
ncbi:Serine/threonine-protein phosphatase 6 regulatory ankyrin repeat subunit A [Cladobotryum mycophilum]|uniref:Serine/threonine-protein phosphatase 6 regulatory ankyrin repeat subunit A n=1 Tax=Cladobotryum mycophilum TaxID=491253 RepID=A0ABR0SNF3_9HYPO